MAKKKRKKYSFLTEQKRIENKELANFFHALKQDRDLALSFLDDYAPKFPQLYRRFQAQLEASVSGCIYIQLEPQKASPNEISVHIYFAPKSFLEEMLNDYDQVSEIQNLLDYVSAWEQDRQQVPLGIDVGYWLEATTFPVPSPQEIIDSPPLPPTSSPSESSEHFD